MINWHDFGMGFWLVLGALVAILVVSLLTGAFRKVS